MITIKEALQRALTQGIERFDAEVLLAHALRQSRAYLIARSEHPVDETIVLQYQQWLQRRQQGEPVAYILGYKEFWSLPIRVTSDTLIPRADTECWLEWLLQLLADKHQLISVLELGTGSGAIAIALAHEKPEWSICAVDRSAPALTVARENAKVLLCPNIEWLQSDWYQALSARKFAVIVANPPYIAEEEPHWQLGDLRFEPKTALVAADHGLSDLRHIIQQAPRYLYSQGLLLVEHGYQQAIAVQQLFKDAGFVRVETHRDYGQQPRWTVGWI